MNLSQTVLHEIANRLIAAEATRIPIAPLTTQYPELGEEEAYSIQNITAAHHSREGKRLVGYKVGLTSREAQKYFKVFQPDFGHLFEGMILNEESEIPMDELIQPKIEGEIAFVLGKDLKGPGITIVDVVKAVDHVLCAMEIVDSRIENWKISAADTISDNGSSARLVLGGKKTKLEDVSLPDVGMAFSRNGEVVLTGAGSAVMGNPLNAVVFLANELGRHGKFLLAGEVILSGALGGMTAIKPLDYYTCEMLKLGRVSIRAGHEEV